MHPAVQRLAQKYGIPISCRIAGRQEINQFIWNGQDLANHWIQPTQRGKELEDWIVPLSDHNFLHEIAHWVVASPEQRTMPEYGLGPAFQTSDVTKYPVIIDELEGDIQEYLCRLICSFWGERHSVSVKLSQNPFKVYSWEEYNWLTYHSLITLAVVKKLPLRSEVERRFASLYQSGILNL